jgi:predicted transposase/invertase (TIGR01784 family)
MEQIVESYEQSINAYRDIKNSLDTAKKEGKAEGKAEEKVETALKMKQKGLDLNLISDITGLSIEEIEQL